MEPPLTPSAEGSGEAPSWSASTNWTSLRGSLQGAICFDSSASILEEGDDGDDGAASVSGGLLLTRPFGLESAPCEITICFRERHEIHRIYVRSTARVYEIYYASEWQDRGSEYLCTVRCGATEKEAFLPRCDSGEDFTNPLKDSNPSREIPRNMTKSESNTSSEEDGWVEVKIPDSPLLGDGSSTFSKKQDGATVANSQIYYEATAEISDASPCTSIMLRLLSLQIKECVHIEEIYIYADPVESSESGAPLSTTGNMSGNSLLAMLVPSMLQLSKAGSSKLQDRTVSSNPAVQKQGLDASIISEEMNPKIARAEMQKTCSSVEKKEQVLAPTVLKETTTTLDSEKEVPSLHRVPEAVPEKDNSSHGQLENLLDDLVLRVGRIEGFLSRFEENMLKPLACIDTRLQQVERQLDALQSRTMFLKPYQCSRISAPEFQFDDFDSDGVFDISDVSKEDATVDSPDVVKGDTTINSPDMVEEGASVDGQNMVGDMPAGSAVSPAADEAAFVPTSDMCPGLFIKAPEFMNEEDEHVSSNDLSESPAMPCPKAKGFLSIDDALSSALKAFMLTTSTTSPNNDISSVPESQSSNVAVDNPKMDGNVMACGASEISGTIFNETNQVHSVYVDPRSDLTFEWGEGQGIYCQEQTQGIRGVAIEEVSSNNQCYVDRADASAIAESENGGRKGIDNDSEVDEAPNEVPSAMRDFRVWDEESSSDSTIEENVIEGHHRMDWLDENSTDSDNEPYALRNWLYGHQDDHRFQEANFVEATNGNDTNAEVSDKSLRGNGNNPEIQKALDSSANDELRSDSQQVLDSRMNEQPSLLDVQFVRHEKSNYAFHLDVLMMDMVYSETEGNELLNGTGKKEQCDSSLSKIAELGAPVAADGLLIDFDEVTVNNNDFSTEGTTNQQLFSSLI